MPEDFNIIPKLREVFRIPESVRIIPLAKLNPTRDVVPVKKYDFNIDATDNRDAPIGISELNTYIYADLEFGAGKWETDTKGVFKEFPAQKYAAVLIQLSRPTIIERTEMQGREGKVKEYIAMSDWNIQIDGIITGKNGQYPADKVADLKKMLEAPIEIDLISTYLQSWGIFSGVIVDRNIPQEAGSYSYQQFSITMESDTPVELRISEADV